MRKYAFITKLEESMEGVNQISFEESLAILNKKNVSKGMEKVFADVDTIYEYDINNYTKNRVVRSLLYLYARMNDIVIGRIEQVSVSDLSEGIIEYGKAASRCKKYSSDEIEILFSEKKDVNKVLIINSYINYVYLEALRYSTDVEVFEDLLSLGNVTLINAVETYDNSKHISFELYLSYLMNEAISSRLYEITRAKNTNSRPVILIQDSPEDRIIERLENRQIVEELINNSNLTTREKQVIDLKFGFIDGIPYDSRAISSILNIDPISVTVLEVGAMKKLKTASNKKTR